MGADFCNISPGDIVAVWGCGGVGLAPQKAAYLLGAGRVIGIDRFPERLQAARDQVGSETIDYSKVDSVLEVLKKSPVDAVPMRASTQSGWKRTERACSTATTA